MLLVYSVWFDIGNNCTLNCSFSDFLSAEPKVKESLFCCSVSMWLSDLISNDKRESTVPSSCPLRKPSSIKGKPTGNDWARNETSTGNQTILIKKNKMVFFFKLIVILLEYCSATNFHHIEHQMHWADSIRPKIRFQLDLYDVGKWARSRTPRSFHQTCKRQADQRLRLRF